MWKDLTLKEKAEIMKMSVANGVTDINDIQELYDNSIDDIDNSVYAEGGHLYKNAGPLNKGKKKQQSINYHLNDAQSFIGELIAAGASPAQAAGVGGNVWVESRFNAAAENNINGGHWGLVQNDANIKKHIVKYYGDYSRASQMRFLKDGLTGQIRGAKQAPWLQRRFDDYRKHTKGVTDASIAAKYFHDDYEKSNNEGVADRMKAASVYQAQMNGVDMSKFVPQDYSDYANRTYQPMQMMTIGNSFKPITLSSANVASPWMDYLSKISQQSPVLFNTPIGPTRTKLSTITNKPMSFNVPSYASNTRPEVMENVAQLPQYQSILNSTLFNDPYLLFKNV